MSLSKLVKFSVLSVFGCAVLIANTPLASADWCSYGSCAGSPLVSVRHQYRHEHERGMPRFKAERLVQLLYRAILFRGADPTGLYNNTNRVQAEGYRGLLEVARGIGDSPEFQDIYQRYGAEAVVINCYEVYFGRYPELARPWPVANMIEQGRPGEAMEALVDSQEFRQKHLF